MLGSAAQSAEVNPFPQILLVPTVPTIDISLYDQINCEPYLEV